MNMNIILNHFSQSTKERICSFVSTYDIFYRMSRSSSEEVITDVENYNLFVTACKLIDVGANIDSINISNTVCQVGSSVKCKIRNPYSGDIGCEHVNIASENELRSNAFLAFTFFKEAFQERHELKSLEKIPNYILFCLFKKKCEEFLDEHFRLWNESDPVSVSITRQHKIHAPSPCFLITRVTDKGVVITDVDNNSYLISNSDIEYFLVPMLDDVEEH